MDYLVFQTEAEAKTALETIYSNMVEEIDSPDLIDVATDTVVPKDELTPAEAVQVDAGNRHFPVFGKNAASQQKDPEQGYTTAWSVAQETLLGTWVFPKPADELMAGLEGYTVVEFNQDWFLGSELLG